MPSFQVKSDPKKMVACRRQDIISRLEGILSDMEQNKIQYPAPKAVIVSGRCECGPGDINYNLQRDAQCLDGEPAKPNFMGSTQKYKWQPANQQLEQQYHEAMPCYEAGSLDDLDCGCVEGEGHHTHYGRKPSRKSIPEKVHDYCTMGVKEFYCPIDKDHAKHWSPYKGTCQYPRPCPAQCFDHSDKNDWIDVTPLKRNS